MTTQIDYSHYSREALFDVLEQVDDQQYPENARAAYWLLRNKFTISPQDIEDRYQDDGLLLSVVKHLLLPFGGEQSISKQEMQAKLQRINTKGSVHV